VVLKRTHNAEYVSLCPFHQEKSPSFHVYRGKDGRRVRWHCFGCGADGDAIDRLTKVEGESWKEAGDIQPIPEIRRQRQRQRRREKALQEYRDRNRDCVMTDDFLKAGFETGYRIPSPSFIFGLR
jgi:DNA primase